MNRQLALGGIVAAAVIGVALFGGFHVIEPQSDFAGRLAVVVAVFAVLGLFVSLAVRACLRLPGLKASEAAEAALAWIFAVVLAAVGVRTLVILFEPGDLTALQGSCLRFADIVLTASVLAGTSRLWDRIGSVRWDAWPFKR